MDFKGGFLGKYPIANMIVSGIIGVAFWIYGIFKYLKILSLEENGGGISMPRIFWKIYDLFGAKGILVFFILGGVFFIYRSFSEWKKIKIKNCLNISKK
ncbi:hypothetical protein [Riemerella columbipharyngis]|uniref:Uncharacterized protein n=1 Tax=Riemerella columbipharyngis TaxID=1071918 RepID=A0A1G7E654_9FLAO|nr:hypothetical protein [Riemerella columbipharyngis]SDE59142.1 hypothetical protein SAMN05421544_11434 [Riemerella columbipharyngis]